MKVTALVENTAVSSEFKAKHGLSLYVETEKHKLLFDLGTNGLFQENAEKLGIDLTAVDTVVISHGHRDHGGALKQFLGLNSIAKVYIHEDAFGRYRSKAFGLMWNIGLDRSLQNDPRIIHTGRELQIDEELYLFSGTSEKRFWAESNGSLYVKDREGCHLDDFRHEQYLVLTENGHRMLLSGCAHRGIVNIVDEAEKRTGEKMDWCISGFHLYDPIKKTCENRERVIDIAQNCKARDTRFITCHCTGEEGYRILKEVMGERIGYIRTGESLSFG